VHESARTKTSWPTVKRSLGEKFLFAIWYGTGTFGGYVTNLRGTGTFVEDVKKIQISIHPNVKSMVPVVPVQGGVSPPILNVWCIAQTSYNIDCVLGSLCYTRPCSIWIAWKRSSPMKGELRWRGPSSISKFHHHNINGGAVDDTWRHR
jgi:hypothetical protein